MKLFAAVFTVLLVLCKYVVSGKYYNKNMSMKINVSRKLKIKMSISTPYLQTYCMY